MIDKTWDIKLYETSRGEKPVREFITSLERETGIKVANTLLLLKENGPFLGMPHARKLRGNLYELRIRGRQEVRLFYGFRGDNAYLVHGFIKKTDKTPPQEIALAERRLASLI